MLLASPTRARAVRLGTRLGRDIDGVRELEVCGRRTGKTRRTPVKVLEVHGERYLVPLHGSSGWVQSLRSGGVARLRCGRDVEDARATEIADDEKRPIALAYLAAAGRQETRKSLAWATDGVSEEEARRGTMSVPIFKLSGRATSP